VGFVLRAEGGGPLLAQSGHWTSVQLDLFSLHSNDNPDGRLPWRRSSLAVRRARPVRVTKLGTTIEPEIILRPLAIALAPDAVAKDACSDRGSVLRRQRSLSFRANPGLCIGGAAIGTAGRVVP